MSKQPTNASRGERSWESELEEGTFGVNAAQQVGNEGRGTRTIEQRGGSTSAGSGGKREVSGLPKETGEGTPSAPVESAGPPIQEQPLGKSMQEHIRSIGGGDQVERVAVLSFRALQLYRIAALQKKLVEVQAALFRDGKEPGTDTDGILQKYADAIRNYETLTQDIVYEANSENDKKYVFLGDSTDFQVVERTQSGSLRIRKSAFSTVKPQHQLERVGPLGFRELDKKRRLQRELVTAYLNRLQMAAFGAVALIVPVLIMALHPGLLVDLVTTSVATVLFGLVSVFLGTDASGKDVLASTAAYAAVLVVFVGTSLTPTGA
ncbi:hypothetical protein V8F20_007548 [Naviculisporaceae sp. PSN 640]